MSRERTKEYLINKESDKDERGREHKDERGREHKDERGREHKDERGREHKDERGRENGDDSLLNLEVYLQKNGFSISEKFRRDGLCEFLKIYSEEEVKNSLYQLVTIIYNVQMVKRYLNFRLKTMIPFIKLKIQIYTVKLILKKYKMNI
jgi:hypothetical protein